jgi:hypothetical protein
MLKIKKPKAAKAKKQNLSPLKKLYEKYFAEKAAPQK